MALNLLLVPLAALLRSVFGWFENSFEDGVISVYEWKQLGATFCRMTLPIVGLMYGLNLDPASASGLGIVIDWLVVKAYNAFS